MRRVGRGQSSGRGKTAGRGTKGQSARSGNKKRPEMRDIIKKLPKRRGYGKNRARTVNASRVRAVAVPLARIEKIFESGAEINPTALRERGVLHARRTLTVKIVGNTASKKFAISGCDVSGTARAAIEKAGGSIAK